MDRAALDVVLELGREAGGWCPRGRRAEDGKIPARYPLQETGSWKYPVRTRKNVQESDGTLIITRGKPQGGSALTAALAERLKKTYRVVDLNVEKAGTEDLWSWGREKAIEILNVAGPRESESPGIHDQATRFLQELLAVPKGKGGAGNAQ